MDGALILIGAPGSGKSSVLEELATRLEIADVPPGSSPSRSPCCPGSIP